MSTIEAREQLKAICREGRPWQEYIEARDLYLRMRDQAAAS